MTLEGFQHTARVAAFGGRQAPHQQAQSRGRDLHRKMAGRDLLEVVGLVEHDLGVGRQGDPGRAEFGKHQRMVGHDDIGPQGAVARLLQEAAAHVPAAAAGTLFALRAQFAQKGAFHTAAAGQFVQIAVARLHGPGERPGKLARLHGIEIKMAVFEQEAQAAQAEVVGASLDQRHAQRPRGIAGAVGFRQHAFDQRQIFLQQLGLQIAGVRADDHRDIVATRPERSRQQVGQTLAHPGAGFDHQVLPGVERRRHGLHHHLLPGPRLVARDLAGQRAAGCQQGGRSGRVNRRAIGRCHHGPPDRTAGLDRERGRPVAVGGGTVAPTVLCQPAQQAGQVVRAQLAVQQLDGLDGPQRPGFQPVGQDLPGAPQTGGRDRRVLGVAGGLGRAAAIQRGQHLGQRLGRRGRTYQLVQLREVDRPPALGRAGLSQHIAQHVGPVGQEAGLAGRGLLGNAHHARRRVGPHRHPHRPGRDPRRSRCRGGIDGLCAHV